MPERGGQKLGYFYYEEEPGRCPWLSSTMMPVMPVVIALLSAQVTPVHCFPSVFMRRPCFPQYLPPIGEDLRLTIVSSDNPDHASSGSGQMTFGQITSGSETHAAGEINKGSAEEIDKNAALESNKSGNEGNSAAEENPLDSIRAMFAALRACWVPPPKDSARRGMQYTIRFALKRDGELIAPPRMTYASRDAPTEVRDAYRDAVNATLARCTPLRFSDGMAGAVAGRPIAIRFVDNRSTEKSLQ
ncbi:MAG: hypothetical protein WAK55_07930 [Xanthobacteraceae bacterium]